MKNSALDILIIPSWYPSEMDPNGVPFIRAQARALAKDGHRVTVVFTQAYSVKTILNKRKLMFKTRDNNIEGVREILTYRPKTHLKRIDEITRYLQGKKVLKKLVKKESYKPDILHVHTFLAGKLSLWFSRKYNIPLTTTEHYTGFARGIVKPWQLKRAKNLYYNSGINFAVSGAFAKLLKEKTGGEFEPLPNMVNCDKFNIDNKKTDKETYTYLFVGSLHNKKNPTMLLDSFINLYKNDNSIRLILAGEGELTKALKSKVSLNNLDNIVSFPGFLTSDEVSKTMQNVDAFILPSRFETFGIVVIEAMASGLPVIVTKSGGPESFVKEKENGLIIEQDQKALENAMLNIKTMDWNSSSIRNYVLDNFSEKAVVKKLITRYKNLIENRAVIQASRELSLSGGISKVAYQVALQLIKNGIDVTTYTSEVDPGFSNIGRVMVFDQPKWINKLPGYLKNYAKTKWFVKEVNKIYKYKNRDKNVVTIAHRDSYGADIAVGHSCHKEAIEIKKGDNRLFWWLNPIHRLYLKEERKIFSDPYPKLAAISTSIASEYIKHYNIPAENIEIIANGVDLDRFNPELRKESRAELIKEYGLSNDAFILLFVGNEFRRKGLDFIIDALNNLKDDKTLELFVLGGADKSFYIKTLKELNLLDRVHFTGVRRDAPLFFAGSDLFILPANYEPFGLVGIEALSSGTPILAPKLGGFLDYLVDGKNGYFIERDGMDIASKIKILKERTLLEKMSINARETALEYSWDKIGLLYAKLVNGVIKYE